MAYSTSDIITWALAAQPLAAYGEHKKKVRSGNNVDPDLHEKIYIERKSLEWQYEQNPNDTDGILYEQSNYVYALLFPYLFAAQQATGGGGQVVNPVTPGGRPESIQFEVGPSQFMEAGDTTKTFPSSWRGFDLLFVRGNLSQSTVVNASVTYYFWDSDTAVLTLFGPAPDNGAAQVTELFQFFPV